MWGATAIWPLQIDRSLLTLFNHPYTTHPFFGVLFGTGWKQQPCPEWKTHPSKSFWWNCVKTSYGTCSWRLFENKSTTRLVPGYLVLKTIFICWWISRYLMLFNRLRHVPPATMERAILQAANSASQQEHGFCVKQRFVQQTVLTQKNMAFVQTRV